MDVIGLRVPVKRTRGHIAGSQQLQTPTESRCCFVVNNEAEVCNEFFCLDPVVFIILCQFPGGAHWKEQPGLLFDTLTQHLGGVGEHTVGRTDRR